MLVPHFCQYNRFGRSSLSIWKISYVEDAEKKSIQTILYFIVGNFKTSCQEDIQPDCQFPKERLAIEAAAHICSY